MTTPSRSESVSARPSATRSMPPVSGPPSRRPWSVEDLREIIAQVRPDPAGDLRTLDGRGLAPVQFAAISTATMVEQLLALLALLEPQPGENRTDALVEGIEALLDGQKTILAELAQQRSSLAEIARRLGA